MDSPLFTIIIPTYNSEKFIAACLTSVLNQTFKSFEVLIVDGLSTDDTTKIANSFDDARIKVFSEKDRGIYDAMNKGIKLAKGEWLYFLGSDDMFSDWFVLQDVCTHIKETRPKVVYGNVRILGNAGWAADGEIYDGPFTLSKLLQKNISHQSVFYSIQVIQCERYNLKYSVCADYDLNLRLFSRYNFKYFDRIIANFKGGGYSVIARDNDFSLSEASVKYYFNSVWKKKFSSFKEGIRFEGGKEHHLSRKLYLYLVYFKHRLFEKLR